MNNIQQNSKCTLCGGKDETINHIISECSKLAQMEDRTGYDWVGRWYVGIVQEIKIWPYNQMVYAQTKIRRAERDT